jgi:type II secretory pathway pseudopilin PulG
MSIQLDWHINADQTQQQESEDPNQRNRRRRNRWRLLLAMVVVALVIGVAVLALLWRWQAIQQREEDDLRAAVEAELAAIRVGDQDAFEQLQRSDSMAWLDSQLATYNDYQTLKQAGRLSPQSQIINVTIDEERGRVVIQETIDQQAFRQAWFYWRYSASTAEDTQAGWRRVPPDVTFWGEETTLTQANTVITYRELDAEMAKALAPQVEAWWSGGCQWIGCAQALPTLTVIIDPQAGLPMTWEPDGGWQLRLLSPYVTGRVPTSYPVPLDLEDRLAHSLAERIITYGSEGRVNFILEGDLITYDSNWLKDQVRQWLIARFRGQPAPFWDSLTTLYGPTVMGRWLLAYQENTQLNTLAPILDPNLTSLSSLDIAQLNQIAWGEFFAWRLGLERSRLLQGDSNNFFALYEGGNANPSAATRAIDAAYAQSRPETVQGVAFSYRQDGTLVALVDVTDAAGVTAQISFVWAGDTFIRVS